MMDEYISRVETVKLLQALIGGIITMPKWWAEMPKVPEEESNEE